MSLISRSNLPAAIPSEWGMIYALSVNNVTFGNKVEFKGVKGKTLLICKNDLDKKLKPIDIKSNYKFDYKVVTQEEFAVAWLEKNPKYMAIVITPLVWPNSSKLIYSQNIVDCETGITIGMASGKKVQKKSLKKHIDTVGRHN